MTAANLIRLAAIAALMTGLRSQQAAQLHSGECAGCHDSGPRIGKRQPGVPTGTPGVTTPQDYRQPAESGEYSRHRVLTPVRLYRSDHWTSIHRSDRLSDALRQSIRYLWRFLSPGLRGRRSRLLSAP
jgi:hypothetical protein